MTSATVTSAVVTSAVVTSEKRMLICAPVLPEDDRESGSKRVMATIEMLLEAGWSVTYVSMLGSVASPCVRRLRHLGVRTHIGFDELADELVVGGGFHAAILCFWEVAERFIPALRRGSPNTRILVDSIDLHFLRNGRSQLLSHPDSPARQLDPTFGGEFVREMNAYAAADVVLTVSSKEAAFINELNASTSLARTMPDFEELPPSPYGFEERKGILFVGNFRHAPNISAARFLCEEVLQHLPPEITVEHPISIVGNDLDRRVMAHGQRHPGVRMVGWVPSLIPYLHSARVALLPLQWGAGTKRKGVQALFVGTPVVTTSVGAEGLDVIHEEHVLLADDPELFAHQIVRALTDRELWVRLSENGQSHIRPRHSRQVARRALVGALTLALAKPPKSFPEPTDLESSDDPRWSELRRVRESVAELVPEGAHLAVITKGDPELLRYGGRKAMHFPADESGGYLGYHPIDGEAAIALLGAAIDGGATHLVVPKSSFWWFDHYSDFGDHIFGTYRLCCDEPEACVIFSLGEPAGADVRPARPTTTAPLLGSPRAEAVPLASAAPTSAGGVVPRPELVDVSAARLDPKRRFRVLVLGIVLADREHLAADVSGVLSRSRHCEVSQRWISIGRTPPAGPLADVTIAQVSTFVPKFDLLATALEDSEIDLYDYVVVVDDDIAIPEGFLDAFVALQDRYSLALAQPARTAGSYLDHPIVQQQPQSIVRETRFVEIGPVFSVSRSAARLLLPFDGRSPMGWGYENVWASILEANDLRLGIIDATPIDHSVRRPVANYQWADADLQRSVLLAGNPHLPIEECLQVLRLAPVSSGVLGGPGRCPGGSRASVVIPTRDRAEWLRHALASLAHQTLGPDQFEVVVVDDGSEDDTEAVAGSFGDSLAVRYVRIDRSGIAAAKNIGVLVSTAPVIVFFDDDDVASPGMVEEHVRAHEMHPAEHVAVLGHTDWSPSVEVTPLMRYITGPGAFLFAYPRLNDGQVLDYTYFWGGRSSCKRSLLMSHGLFDPRFTFGCEDVELGFRLASRTALKVVYWPRASSSMARPVTFAQFVDRCRRQGRSQHLFAQMHDDGEVARYCQVEQAEERWRLAGPHVDDVHARVGELEVALLEEPATARMDELHALYRWSFDAAKAAGIVAAIEEAGAH